VGATAGREAGGSGDKTVAQSSKSWNARKKVKEGGGIDTDPMRARKHTGWVDFKIGQMVSTPTGTQEEKRETSHSTGTSGLGNENPPGHGDCGNQGKTEKVEGGDTTEFEKRV